MGVRTKVAVLSLGVATRLMADGLPAATGGLKDQDEYGYWQMGCM